ncbi:hypothetical protein AsAng_0031760 [Aureispira anguillae]|uniref:Macrodomain effector MavL domain-containing protein n=1 Tax=Aureispira anguillae TaxID=2864201 RepID=A0A915YGB9_9BACT|nr:hypothetical protein [Aureispira anguillae]BDS12453.1 hypothetical protein AsAng_0031760 [Aureispira anguillae]
MLFTPGALLRNDRHYPPADWEAVVRAGKINYKQFYQLYERRLLPLLIYANKQAEQLKKQALITIPGLGCGMFAGIFQGELGAVLEQVLIDLLKKYATYFPLIKAIYYDPYKECSNKRLDINGVSLLVRPLLQGNQGKAQLSKPVLLEEEGDDFSNCMLFSVVAWDHVSWPGNDFYINSRATDDGVKAAATDSMWKMTGIKGLYNKKIYAYEPPSSYSNWDAVVAQHDLKITLKGQVLVLPNKEMPL